MNTPPGSRLEKALADFAEQHGTLARAREQMRALSVTARSRDGVVEVTVDADGRAAGIGFVDKRFREMLAPQLGDSVLEALTTARAEVAARATAVMMAANLRLPRCAEPAHRDEPVSPDTVPDTPSVCWRRLVGEARAVVSGLASVREPGVLKADSAVGTWEATAGFLETSRSRSQGPLWGHSRPGARSTSAHAPLPAELRDAVMALRESVCDAVRDSRPPSVCGYVGALERPGRKAESAEGTLRPGCRQVCSEPDTSAHLDS
ncbi:MULTISPECIES: YbaB/EbfC family nucleoid-associated protein [Streptomyces]|uniref:YbaB/EbfC family nucleoid-associated protein n=1 Tax=Streptomyces TaxID=1883 RepID=UPI0023DD0ED9|nr:YbaB/EbfC family nucleoid-associated protein [Streptomyces sp. FXJ1.172]WEP00601.1 YbaB/EbfC family nucleoid-associated protein [Streptomyces sp. FXJ1.172]